MSATVIRQSNVTRVKQEYLALINALTKRGECKVKSENNIEYWTRTYASKRDYRGKLVLLNINKRSWYFVTNKDNADKLLVWVGAALDCAGKLNTSARLSLIKEGENND